MSNPSRSKRLRNMRRRKGQRRQRLASRWRFAMVDPVVSDQLMWRWCRTHIRHGMNFRKQKRAEHTQIAVERLPYWRGGTNTGAR